MGDGSPQRGPRAEPLVGGFHSILRIFGYQTMHNFVYLAKVHEPLVKHEKNLGCSACLFAELSRAYSKEFFGVHNFKSSCIM